MRKILFLAFQFLILHVSATTYYVSTNGKPEGDGSKENPYNITTAVKKSKSGRRYLSCRRDLFSIGNR